MILAKHEVKRDNVVFERDPLRFCQMAYDEAVTFNDENADKVAENRAFYDGYDDVLDRRANDPNVVRSALFIHEARPAIDTRFSSVVDRLEEDAMPVRMTLDDEHADDDELQVIVEEKTEKLNEQMRPFFRNVLYDYFMGGELQPISVVKAYYNEEYEWVPRQNLVMSPGKLAVKYLNKLLNRQQIPEIKTVYDYKLKDASPRAEWLDWCEFLYDPQAKSLDDCKYVIHRRWVTWNDLVNMADQRDFYEAGMRQIKNMEGDNDSLDPVTSESVDEKKDGRRAKGRKEGMILLCEFWVKTYDKNGREYIRVVTIGNSKVMLKNEPSPYRGLRYPFAIRRSWPELGKMEGISSIDLVKDTQRAYADVFNGILDAASYGLWQTILKDKSAKIYGDPVIGPGRMIETNDINGFRELYNTVFRAEFLPPIATLFENKIRQMLNAPDVDQGLEDGADQEKATKTRLRVMGSMRRLRPLFMQVRNDIIDVAWLFIKINQQYDPSWILPVELDIPVLSGVYTPDEELTMALMVYERALQNPLYQNPVGMFKLRELWLKVINAAREKDPDKVCPTEEDVQNVFTLQKVISNIVDQTVAGSPQGGSNGLAQIPSRQNAQV